MHISQEGHGLVRGGAHLRPRTSTRAPSCVNMRGELLSRTEAARRLELYDAHEDGPGHALLVTQSDIFVCK